MKLSQFEQSLFIFKYETIEKGQPVTKTFSCYHLLFSQRFTLLLRLKENQGCTESATGLEFLRWTAREAALCSAQASHLSYKNVPFSCSRPFVTVLQADVAQRWWLSVAIRHNRRQDWHHKNLKLNRTSHTWRCSSTLPINSRTQNSKILPGTAGTWQPPCLAGMLTSPMNLTRLSQRVTEMSMSSRWSSEICLTQLAWWHISLNHWAYVWGQR